MAKKKSKKIFSKIFSPISLVLIAFVVASFSYNYISTDHFVKDNARDEITQALDDIKNQLVAYEYSDDVEFTLSTSKYLISQGNATKVYVYDENFEAVSFFDNTIYQDLELTAFLSSLLQNYELEEDVLTTIDFGGKKYLANTYVTGNHLHIRQKYFVVVQDLTEKSILIRENLRNMLLIQLVILVIAVLTVYKIASDLSKPIIKLSDESAEYIVGKGITIDKEPSDISELETLRDTLFRMQTKINEENKHKNTIYENTAHDLRTPLVSILGYADGLKSGIIKDKKKACDVIIKTGNQLKEMIENILILSRFDNETYVSSFEDVSLADFLSEQIELVRVIDNDKNISLKINSKNVFDNKAKANFDDVIINTDKKLLTRIIQNLLSNAIKYAEDEIVVSVDTLDKKKTSSRKIKISIFNDGVGISKKDLNNIFTRYYKGEDGHFGIGLAVVKSAVEYLGGKIQVESKKNVGTTFTICI